MLATEAKLAMIDERLGKLLEDQYKHYLNVLVLKAQPETTDEREVEDRQRSMDAAARAIASLDAAIGALETERMGIEREARRLPVDEVSDEVKT